MRLFIAIPLEGHVKESLEKLQRRLKKGGINAIWVKASNMHLTVQFLGEMDPARVKFVQKELSDVLKWVSPIELEATGVGAFPSMRRARVLWAGIEGQTSQFGHLVQSVQKRLIQSGILKKSDKAFHPHITLGRFKSFQNLEKRDVFRQISMGSQRISVSQVILYESILNSEGAVHIKKLSVKLKQNR